MTDVMQAVGVLREYLSKPTEATERQFVVATLNKLIAPKEKPKPSSEQLRGFDMFWDLYPKRNGRKVGKPEAKAKWAALDLKEKHAAYRALKNYVEYCGTMPRDACRFLAGGFYQDFLLEGDPVAPERPSWVPAHAVPDGQGGWQT